MTRTTIFANKKYILSSGRELDLSGENDAGLITITAMFNLLDTVQNIAHSALVRIDNKQNISFESVSGASVKELSMPIEGLNGGESSLQVFEMNELISVIQQFVQKIEKEVPAK